MALEFTDSNFESEVLSNEGVTLIDFWAEWCGPCKMLTPIIDELHKDYEGKAKIGKLNVDQNPEVSQNFKVRSIPTIIILKNGEVVDKHVGLASKKDIALKIEAQLQS